ncbi:T9SS type A sorting domain-containing protein [Hymenobacter sp. RP-2-7]|uniref:T9SS type A sorting domain-containing protein n=1 Tax=Hymenobacter polaris TaxID=2682546 RepID=A0A7Y0AEI0_9BACT|nr:CotH kinase family protein [Hymenobacter polaris]NML65875.1 T9SS type A sorting domain-containing protein [Hymenobacter polaris]
MSQPIAAGAQPITALQLNGRYTLAQPAAGLVAGADYQAQRDGVAYSVLVTQLPIVQLHTRRTIVDAPSVYATFALTEPTGTITKANLGIEIRGAWSQTYPKKSYELNMWADTTGATSRDVQLLGMRTDDTWNLLALYNEPLRVNNKVSHELWHELNQLYYQAKETDAKNGVDMAFVEVFLNDEYKGIYALSEKVDRKLLKLKKYNAGIKGELYKGTTRDSASAYLGAPPFDNKSQTWSGFEYKHPDELTDWTSLRDFVRFVTTSSAADFQSQYAKRFQLDNAVDYFIFLNLLRATDNTSKNLYVARYNAKEPYFYVPWDLDGVFGTDWQGLPDNVTNDLLTNGFYQRLIQDNSPTGFRAALVKRWASLRTTIITEDHILGKFRAQRDYLLRNKVYQREHLVWPAFTYDETRLPAIQTWLHARLAYLDTEFGFVAAAPATALAAAAAAVPTHPALYPNPARDYLTVELPTGASTGRLTIRDLSGHPVLQASLSGTTRLPVGHLARGLYAVVVESQATVRVEKLVLD